MADVVAQRITELLRVCPRIKHDADGDIWLHFGLTPQAAMNLSVYVSGRGPIFQEKVLAWATDMEIALNELEVALKEQVHG